MTRVENYDIYNYSTGQKYQNIFLWVNKVGLFKKKKKNSLGFDLICIDIYICMMQNCSCILEYMWISKCLGENKPVWHYNTAVWVMTGGQAMSLYYQSSCQHYAAACLGSPHPPPSVFLSFYGINHFLPLLLLLLFFSSFSVISPINISGGGFLFTEFTLLCLIKLKN